MPDRNPTLAFGRGVEWRSPNSANSDEGTNTVVLYKYMYTN